MMLTIHGLPISVNYKDLKRLVKQECHITDFILDNLVTDDDGCKKVRIGVTDETDGSQLMKFLNGYQFSGHVLRVVPVGKQGQQNQSNFDARGGYQPRNEYHIQPTNFGNQPISHDNQLPRPNAWASNTQWGQPTPVHVQQNTFTHHPQQTPVNNTYIHTQQQARGSIPPLRVPMQHQHPPHQQNFGYMSKNIQELPVPNQYEHQPSLAQGHFQGSSHAQPSPWNPQMQPVKQPFEKPTPGGFNQTTFSDHRQMLKQVQIHDGGYKDYDKGRFQSQLQGQSPSKRVSPRRKMSPEAVRRMSPPVMRGQRMSSPSPQGRKMTSGPEGRRMSPTNHQGRRVSPSGLQGRRMSPTGPQGRRISPPGLQGRRMSPTGPLGRRMSPLGLQGRRTSPTGPQGRRMSPSDLQGRRMSPTALQGRMMSSLGPQGHQVSPSGPQGRRISPTGHQGRRISPTNPQGRRMSPSGIQGRRMSPPALQGRRMSPPGPHHVRRMSPTMPGATDRRASPSRTVMRMSPSRMGGRVPTGRVVTPPHGRKMSPGPMGRMSPGRRMSRMSPGRRVSPSAAHGRRMSPGMSGRRVSPQGVGRRMSPGREMPPDRRLSPADRRVAAWQPAGRRSPPRHRSPDPDTMTSGREYPPSFHQSKKPKYEEDERPPSLKQVRPAYEPPTKAANQAMYSGGYRANIHDNVQYPASSGRQEPWQQTVNKPTAYASSKNLDSRIEKFDIPRVSETLRMGDGESKRSHSANRDSRSPTRRDRSPFKDRYKRHSPSPRSPRRSWALEKRRSPDIRDAPPPPVWPGQNTPDPEFHRQSRQNFPDVSEKINKNHTPTWERPVYDERDDVHRQVSGPEASRRPFPSDEHARGDKWKPISLPSPKEPSGSFRHDDRFADNNSNSHKFIPTEEFDRPSSRDRMSYSDKRDFRDYPPKKDDLEEMRLKKDVAPRREGFLRDDDDRRELLRVIPPDMNKEIEDVYKRVAELGKKAQEFRKKDSRFEDRDDQYYNRSDDPVSGGSDVRRDTSADGRYRDDVIGRREEDVRSRHSDEADRPVRQRASRWSNATTDSVWRLRKPLTPAVKAKRDKAAEELVRRIMNRFKHEIADSQRERIQNELSLSITRIFYDMFKDEDVSYIELVIRFNKKYDSNDEAKIFEEVMSSFSSGYRKRVAQVESAGPAKTAKRSPDDLTKDVQKGNEFQNVAPYTVPEWNLNPIQPVNANEPTAVAPPLIMPMNAQISYIMNPGPMMVPTPSYLEPSNLGFEPIQEPSRDVYNLFMCKDGFQPFDDRQAEQLKSYLVSQMIEESDKSDGWAPDFIMKGLQSAYRYDIVAQDERSMEWLLNLDFGKFSAFNVLVYTGEELWYERAAIWLPGHSRCRHIEPLNKLKLQNKKLEGVHIGKWKFVRKVVTQMGTRIYVDIPPSSARSLENYKNMLSYELQKVSVFLKAAAVDKNAFDAGLDEPSINYVPPTHNSPMPSLAPDLNVVKIGIKGNKHTSLPMARKIKDMIVYKLYQYLQQGGSSSTDFLKYGFCAPGYLGVVPENAESRRWIVGLNIGTLNRQSVVVIGGDETNIKYIKMYVLLPPNVCNTSHSLEKLKQSNQGVKGLNFSAWKNPKMSLRPGAARAKLEVHMDLESVETIAKLDYELDYVDETGQEPSTVPIESDYSLSELEKIIKNYRDEMTDTYDIANMDIDSNSDDDVVCLS